ncbi:sugar phosphate isomerase/epimerase family protein [Luteitalea sp.]
MLPRISVFPKCYFDELCAGRMDYLQWLRDARTLGGEGIEHYDGFLTPLGPDAARRVRDVMEETGQVSSLLCFSPDFTHPDADERARQVQRQRDAIDMSVALGLRHCRTLSGQRLPGMSRSEGVRRTVEGITASLEYAAERDVVLCMENHYKDGNWTYPEFAQAEDVFLEIIGQIDHPHFGVQYDPSNALVGGYDPLAFLEKVKHRVVSMHASDRYLADGATLEDLKQADGSTGYSAALKHGETGKGLNDYDTIFRLLAEVGYDGWISIEDGMNGLDELTRSAEFLKAKRAQYYGG